MNAMFVMPGGEAAAGIDPDGAGGFDPLQADDGSSGIEEASSAGDAGRRVRAERVDESTLAALIDRIVDHDQRAFEAFHDALQSRLVVLVRRFTGDRALIDEVVEESFFQVWRDAPRFDPARGRASAWVLAIARSRTLDALRRVERASVELHLEDEELESAIPSDTEADPLHRLDASRRAGALRAALERLEAQPRQLVSLAFFRGMTHEEVAAETGLPLGTVKSSIRRALCALKGWLDPTLSTGPAM